MEPAKPSNIILEQSFIFAKEIIGLCDRLYENRKYILANQLLKSGTSIGANIREAQGAESRLDFVHKMKIAAKEAEETDYWLSLLHDVYELPAAKDLQKKLLSIRKLLSKIISSSKRSSGASSH
jgi:four helix bundle protein